MDRPGGNASDRLQAQAEHLADPYRDQPADPVDRLRATLAGLPESYVHLWLALPKTAAAGEKVSGTRDAPTPLNLGVEALMRDIAATVTTWERIVRDHARLSDVAESRQETGIAISRACATLAAHARLLLDLPAQTVWEWDDQAGTSGAPTGAHFQGDPTKIGKGSLPRGDAPDGDWVPVERNGEQAARTLNRLGARCRATLGITRLVHRLPVPCPTCDVLALTRESGAAEVRCMSCGRVEPEERYQRLAWVVAEDMAAKMAAEEGDAPPPV